MVSRPASSILTVLSLAATLAAACSTYDSTLLVDEPEGSSGGGGVAGASGGKGGASAHAGASGAGQAGQAGKGGTAGAGQAGTAGAGQAGTAGAGQAGTAGAGQAGTAGAGQAGTAGAAGAGGQASCTPTDCDDSNPCTKDTCDAGTCKHEPDSTGTATDDGNPCTKDLCDAGKVTHQPELDTTPCALQGGGAGACKAGQCQVSCATATECDDGNPCTTDTCATFCQHTLVPDDTPTPGVTPDPKDCKKIVCVGGVSKPLPDDTESPDDGNVCTTDTCAAGTAKHANVTDGTKCDGVDVSKHCVKGACLSNACGDGVRAGAEECDGKDLGGKTCADYGYSTPAGLACSSACALFTAGCKPVCGNGALEPGEECDDSNLVAGDGCSKACTKEPAVGALVITEIMFNPTNPKEPEGEWMEVYNASSMPIDMRGLRLVSNTAGTKSHVIDGASPVVIQPGQYFVFGHPSQAQALPAGYYAYPATSIGFANSADNVRIEIPAATPIVIDTVAYPGSSGTYSGKSRSFTKALVPDATANDVASNWCPATTQWAGGPDYGTPGAANDCP